MTARSRAEEFCQRFGLRVPILLAPMAGASPPALAEAVIRAGGMGALGGLLLQPDEIHAWARAVRSSSPGPFQINLWVPDPAPTRDPDHEAAVGAFLAGWGPPVPPGAGDATPLDFPAQCRAVLDAHPVAVSSIMGLFPPETVAEIKAAEITWFASVSTVDEAVQAADAGADVLVAQGMEAGGHRAAFDADRAERELVGLLALVPAVVDAVALPVVATGGIADARGLAAALTLGASAVQIGTGYLRTPEAGISAAWADAIGAARPEATQVSRVFSGRAGRSIVTPYVRAATRAGAPHPAPYPVQRGLTAAMRLSAARADDVDRMQAWAGQAAALARAEPATELTRRLWAEAEALLP